MSLKTGDNLFEWINKLLIIYLRFSDDFDGGGILKMTEINATSTASESEGRLMSLASSKRCSDYFGELNIFRKLILFDCIFFFSSAKNYHFSTLYQLCMVEVCTITWPCVTIPASIFDGKLTVIDSCTESRSGWFFRLWTVEDIYLLIQSSYSMTEASTTKGKPFSGISIQHSTHARSVLLSLVSWLVSILLKILI